MVKGLQVICTGHPEGAPDKKCIACTIHEKALNLAPRLLHTGPGLGMQGAADKHFHVTVIGSQGDSHQTSISE
eukprot:scaffold308078_cov21-Tisochrysis_lutea.AAC.1